LDSINYFVKFVHKKPEKEYNFLYKKSIFILEVFPCGIIMNVEGK